MFPHFEYIRFCHLTSTSPLLFKLSCMDNHYGPSEKQKDNGLQSLTGLPPPYMTKMFIFVSDVSIEHTVTRFSVDKTKLYLLT